MSICPRAVVVAIVLSISVLLQTVFTYCAARCVNSKQHLNALCCLGSSCWECDVVYARTWVYCATYLRRPQVPQHMLQMRNSHASHIALGWVGAAQTACFRQPTRLLMHTSCAPVHSWPPPPCASLISQSVSPSGCSDDDLVACRTDTTLCPAYPGRCVAPLARQ